MKVLITGANGLLGSCISLHLVHMGHQIVAAVRPGADLSLLSDIKDQLSVKHLELSDVTTLRKLVEEVEAVVHCAGMVSFSPHVKSQLFEANVKGTANVCHAMSGFADKHLIHISSVAALGRSPGILEIDEEQQWEESEDNSYYACTKYWAELEVFRATAEGIKASILCPSIVIAPTDIKRSSGRLIGYVLKELPFYPRGVVNLVDVRDIAKAVDLCLQKKSTGRYILSSRQMEYKELLEALALKLNKRPPRYPFGQFLSGILWRVEWIRSWLFKSDPLITKETAKISGGHYKFSGDKAVRELGLQYYSFEDTLNFVFTSLVDNKSH
jgi:dihydroflavonol-4-reductase